MLVYIAVFLFLIILYFTIQNTELSEKKANEIFLIISFFVIVLVFGSRHNWYSFSDEGGYYRVYKSISSMSFDKFWKEYREEPEVGYYLFNFLLSRIIEWPQFIIYATTAISVGTTFYFIYKTCRNPLLAVFAYFGTGIFAFEMTGFRQSMAMSLVLIASILIFDNKKIIGAILIGLAYFFHNSALVGLLLLFVAKEKLTIKQSILYLLLISILLFGSTYLEKASETIDKNYDKQNNFTLLGYVIQMIIIFSPFVLKEILSNSSKEMINPNLYFARNVVFSCGVIYFARFISQSYERISYYFTTYVLCLYDDLVYSSDNKKDQEFLAFVFILLFMLLTLYRVSSGRMSTFVFFWQK